MSESEPLRCVRVFATPWTLAHQAPLSMGFSRQEYWSGLPFPSPGDLPIPGIYPRSPTLQADSLPSEPPGKASKVQRMAELCWGHEKGRWRKPGTQGSGALPSSHPVRSHIPSSYESCCLKTSAGSGKGKRLTYCHTTEAGERREKKRGQRCEVRGHLGAPS